MIGKENYETGSLLDYPYYKKEYKLEELVNRLNYD